MPTVINTNLASLFAQNNLSSAQNNLATSVQRLSSGLRINSAKDDAAGLAISQNMQGQINGVNQSIRNLSDATNMIQTADSSLATIQDMLLRMKQLATQGYDGSLSTSQKGSIVNELSQLNEEINATAYRTRFNGNTLLATANTVENNTADVFSGQSLNTALSAPSFATTATINAQSGTMATGFIGAVTGATAATAAFVLPSGDDLAKLVDKTGTTTFTFEADGRNLTLQASINGVYTTDTVSISDSDYTTGTTTDNYKTLNFEKFGITLSLNIKTNTALTADVLGDAVASAFDGDTFTLTGETSKITDIKLSGAESGTYTLTDNNSGTITMGWTDASGTAHSDAINLANTSGYSWTGGEYTTVDFKAAGIKLEIYNFQTRTGTEIADQLSALSNYAGAGTGELIVKGNGTSSLAFQSGPDAGSYIDVETINVMTATEGIYAGSESEMTLLGTKLAGDNGLTTLTSSTSASDWASSFTDVADAIDVALDWISEQRGIFGAQMNRLSYLSSNLQATSTNMQASRSSIIDTDFASETAQLTKGQIMQQAATAMLAQANQMPNVILSLLK
jgi:flagellin